MKRILLLFSLLLSLAAMAQDYETQWQDVIRLEKSGLIKSAAEKANAIYLQAKKDRNEPQMLKTFFFRSKYMLTLEEEAQQKIIADIKADMETASPDGRAIMESLYASLLEDMRYNWGTVETTSLADTAYVSVDSAAVEISEIYPDTVTAVTEGYKDPIETLFGSPEAYDREIDAAYRRSIENRETLYSIPLEKYGAVIDFNSTSRRYKRPLYDFLAERYLDYLSRPGSHYYEIKYADMLFGDTPEFLSFTATDSLDPPFAALIAGCRDLEAFYLKKKDSVSLTRAALRRLGLMGNHLAYGHDDAYMHTLEKLSRGNTPDAWLAALKLVNFYRNRANDKSIDYLAKAVALSEKIIANTVNPDATAAAMKLREDITKTMVSIESKEFFPPGTPQLARVEYNNTASITLRWYRLSYGEFTTPNEGYSHYLAYSKNHKPYIEKQYLLPGENDYRGKMTEIILPPLPAGIYLMAVTSPDGQENGDTHGFSIIQATGVNVLRANEKEGMAFDINDRITGKPLKGAVISYRGKKYTSGKDGRIVFKSANDENESEISSIRYGRDTLALDLRYYRYYGEPATEESVLDKTVIYLDRAIYRPGQELYFKGICMTVKNGVQAIAPNTTVFVKIEDANDEKLAEFTLTTNAFGSFSGTYTIPATVMTGNFTIRAYRTTDEYHSYNYTSFRVEEYKRPSFEIAFDPVKEAIHPDVPTVIRGRVTAYNGAAVANARVVYVIQASRYARNRSSAAVTGTVQAGADGAFAIPFTAVAYAQDPEGYNAVYYYTVSVSVTDMGGETRSASKGLTAARRSVNVSVAVPPVVTKGEAIITFDSKNLNGTFMPVEGEIKIYRLIDAENRLTGNRPWAAPDKYRIPKEEFIRQFPYIPYDGNDEDVRGEVVYTQKVNTATTKTVAVKGMDSWGTGQYEVVFTPSGEENKGVEATAPLYFRGEGRIDPNRLFDYRVSNTDFAKDGYIALEMATPAQLYINVQAGHGRQGRFFNKMVTLDGTRKIVKIPLPKGIKGTIGIGICFSWQNEDYSYDIRPEVQRPEEKLEIEAKTMNEKMLPGSPQAWSFKIKGRGGAVEALASMYDASLDQFSSEQWEPLQDGDETYYYYHDKQPFTGGTTYCDIGNRYEGWDVILDFPDLFLHETRRDLLTLVSNGQKEKSILAQGGYMLTGIVSVSGGRAGDVLITSVGSGYTVVSDIDGLFRMAVKAGDVLEVSGEGYWQRYRPATIPVNGRKAVLVKLKPEEEYIGKSTFSGYGTIRNYINERSGRAMAASMIREMPMNQSVATDSLSVGLNYELGNSGSEMYTAYSLKLPSPQYLVDKDKPVINIQPRRNFKETAFFYPHLTAAKDGSITFTFTTPEALTEWKLRLLAHNKDAVSAYFEQASITQKDLMVMPNMPRFLREKDTVVLTTRIISLSDKPLQGEAVLQLYDAATMQPVDARMMNADNTKPFSVAAKGTTTVSWKIAIPEGLQGIQYKVLAKAGNFTDGEENILPILPNSMLVTESIPVWVKPNTSKEYTFDNLKKNASPTLRHQGITLEYTSNPAWLALKSLPYLMEYEHQCAEQVFSRYYANAIATHIVDSNPAIAAVFAEWQKSGASASKFAQNPEIKSIVMAETPWVLDAESEEEQKNRLALLFDLNRMKAGLSAAFEQLSDKQLPSGAFPWFDGGPENEYITRHILAGLGHLQKLGIKQPDEQAYHTMKMEALNYLDGKFMERAKKPVAATAKDRTILPAWPYDALHYLYARSFYITPYEPIGDLQKEINVQLNMIKEKWLKYSLYEKGMAALVLHRFGDTASAKKIVESLRQTSANNEEWGMYWIANKPGWFWYEAPVETQALLIEAFTEIDNDTKSADAMKVWLIKQKQNRNWPTTKSTSEAVYALLMKGSDWLSVEENTVITLGDNNVLAKKIAEVGKEAQTGYMKLQWKPEEINKSMATLKIGNRSAVPGYGGFYWQYFEDLDKIVPAQKGIMNVSKELYLKTDTAKGPQLQRITTAYPLRIGDLVTVRLVITIKEDVEYVHLKDMRAAAFEPVDVLSGYHGQNGLGYYQSTRDAATHFFFDSITRGTYVLEYEVRVNNAGEFSNGITTIESMYAPEFSGHTKGMRVKAMEK